MNLAYAEMSSCQQTNLNISYSESVCQQKKEEVGIKCPYESTCSSYINTVCLIFISVSGNIELPVHYVGYYG